MGIPWKGKRKRRKKKRENKAPIQEAAAWRSHLCQSRLILIPKVIAFSEVAETRRSTIGPRSTQACVMKEHKHIPVLQVQTPPTTSAGRDILLRTLSLSLSNQKNVHLTPLLCLCAKNSWNVPMCAWVSLRCLCRAPPPNPALTPDCISDSTHKRRWNPTSFSCALFDTHYCKESKHPLGLQQLGHIPAPLNHLQLPSHCFQDNTS